MKVRLPSPAQLSSFNNISSRGSNLPLLLLSSNLTTQSRKQRPSSICTPLNNHQRHNSSTSSTPAPNPSHFLSTTYARLGKCITFGLNTSQLHLCSQILTILCREWISLIAGREGYVVSRAGVRSRRVIWGEQDSMGHVNNVMYVRYAETGRVEWLCNLGDEVEGEGKRRRKDAKERERWKELMTPTGEKGVILKSIKVDYKFPLKWPDRISVFHKLRNSPANSPDPSSFVLDVLILSEVHQRPAARCEEDIVVYDYKKGKKAEVSGFMKEGFERAWREQEQARIKAQERIEELEGMVRRLEQESWDREDAVEDMGGPKTS